MTLDHNVDAELPAQTGDIKLIQQALNRRGIKTALRYAHVLNNEITHGLEQVSATRKSPRAGKQKTA